MPARASSIGCLFLLLWLGYSALIQVGASGDADAKLVTSNVTGMRNDSLENHGRVSAKVWLISCVSILVISLVGLAGVAVVPMVHSAYYNHFIQYLVALAVGSLTGDAMLHLLPHAIVKSAMEDAHAERWHDEQQTVLKGLVALGGVYFFFMAEKLVALVTEYRSEQQALLEEERKEIQEGHPNRLSTLERQKRRASRLYGGKSCEDIITTGLSSKAMRSIDNFRSYMEYSDSEDADRNSMGCDQEQQQQQQQSPDTTPVKQRYRQHRRKSHEPPPAQLRGNNSADDKATTSTVATSGGGGGGAGEIRLVVPGQSDRGGFEQPGEEGPAQQEQQPAGGHGHGHGHGSEIPRSLVSVAWMVILGDGLHNFTDGLAIGAAFAQSMTGGISTSIAVFCHELPHELGDFAVLLKTGMAVRQALFYNIVSSVLAAVGMAIGVNLGTVTSASYWIFAITGGIFIYISLVDMLPELNLVNVKPGESRIAHFILQNAGILTGVAVMFLIAIYEDKMKGMLGEGEHEH